MTRDPRRPLDNITILIKTFERQDCLRRLLRSIVQRGYIFPVLVADDSLKPYRDAVVAEFGGLVTHYLVLPFDVGLSAGRNAMLPLVHTPYLLLCDDDFVFDERTDLAHMQRLLEGSGMDLLGGVYYDRAPFSWRDLMSATARLDGLRLLTLAGFEVPRKLHFNFARAGPQNWRTVEVEYTPPVVRCDLASNFFLARTGPLRDVVGGWDASLKLAEHRSFFLAAKRHGLRVGHTEEVGVVHVREMPGEYWEYRRRGERTPPAEFVRPTLPERFSALRETWSRTYRHYRARRRPPGLGGKWNS